MKKRRKSVVLFILILTSLLFSSCIKEGPIGPQGPIGPCGPQGIEGQGGNANAVSSTVMVFSNDWRWVNDCQWMAEINLLDINENVYNYGAVLIYMEVDSSWLQVPLTYYYQDSVNEHVQHSVSIEVAILKEGRVRLTWTEKDGAFEEIRPGTHSFKIVTIEAIIFNCYNDVDYNNFESVKDAFQLI